MKAAVGFNYRHVPSLQYARDLVRSGTLGRINSVRVAIEVFSALDMITRACIIELMCALSKRTAFVVVSHDIALVALLCEQLIVLEKGRIVERDNTLNILAYPQHRYTKKLLTSLPRMPQPA